MATPTAVPFAFVTEIMASYLPRGVTKWRQIFNCALLEKIVVGVRNPDHPAVVLVQYDEWVADGWIEAEPDPGFFICPSCLVHDETEVWCNHG